MSDDDSATADAFGAIGNEHRIDILQSLMSAYRNDETPIPYTELMDAVGTTDSGHFNYHLQQLVGRFVSESATGYALTYAGRTVVSAVASGTLDRSATLERTPVDGACYACGERALFLHYPDERVRVTCGNCDEEVVHIQFPPMAVSERSVSVLKRDFDRWARRWRSLAGKGICPECSGKIVGELGRESGTPTVGNVDVRAVIACQQCWVRGGMPPGLLVIDHPAVVSFFWERGVDIREKPLWQHDWALRSDNVRVIDEDPLRIEIEATLDGDTISLRIDEGLAVEAISERD